MRLLELFLSFISFRLLNCSEVLSNKSAVNRLEFIGSDLIHYISTYLDNPFLTLAPLNRYFRRLFTEVYTAKRIFNDRFNFPEFFTDDVDDNDKEFKYLLNYHKFVDPRYIYRGFYSEFLYGNKIDSLMIPSIKFLKRLGCLSRSEIENVLSRRKITKYYFQVKADIPIDCIHELQMSIVSNPENMKIFRDYLKLHTPKEIENFKILDEWIQAALSSNLPDMLFMEFSDNLKRVLKSTAFWTKFYIPVNFYSELFDRINVWIDQLFNDDPLRNFYVLLNAIRFGPTVPDLYEARIESAIFSYDETDLMCYCASLSNKKDLFYNLIYDRISYFSSIIYRIIPNNAPIEMYKILFDIYSLDQEEISEDDSSFEMIPSQTKGVIWKNDSSFERFLFRKCLVSSFEWYEGNAIIEFETLSSSIDYAIPKRFTLKRAFFSENHYLNLIFNIPSKAKFANNCAFESYLALFLKEVKLHKRSKILINGVNLKLIIRSESIQRFLRQGFRHTSEVGFNSVIRLFCYRFSTVNTPTPVFQVRMEEVLKVVDEPVCFLGDIVALSSDNLYGSLVKFRTIEQLERFETLFDFKIESLKGQNFDYFTYRHIFKYLMDKERTLPANLSDESRKLLKIEYPFLQI